MATKVLELLWNLAHRDDCPTDTMDHALVAHIKILDYSCSQVTASYSVANVLLYTGHWATLEYDCYYTSGIDISVKMQG